MSAWLLPATAGVQTIANIAISGTSSKSELWHREARNQFDVDVGHDEPRQYQPSHYRRFHLGTYFSETNTCGSTLGPHKSCNVNVIFAPGSTGTFSGAVSIGDDGGGSPSCSAAAFSDAKGLSSAFN